MESRSRSHLHSHNLLVCRRDFIANLQEQLKLQGRSLRRERHRVQLLVSTVQKVIGHLLRLSLLLLHVSDDALQNGLESARALAR